MLWKCVMEFSRIVGKNQKQEFYERIDRHSPRRLELFRSKRDYRANCDPDTGAQRASCHPTGQPHKLLQIKAGFESDDDDSSRDLDIGILLIEREGAGIHIFLASQSSLVENHH